MHTIFCELYEPPTPHGVPAYVPDIRYAAGRGRMRQCLRRPHCLPALSAGPRRRRRRVWPHFPDVAQTKHTRRKKKVPRVIKNVRIMGQKKASRRWTFVFSFCRLKVVGNRRRTKADEFLLQKSKSLGGTRTNLDRMLRAGFQTSRCTRHKECTCFRERNVLADGSRQLSVGSASTIATVYAVEPTLIGFEALPASYSPTSVGGPANMTLFFLDVNA